MRFRDWFIEQEGSTLTIPSLIGTNSNMPCKSKYEVSDGVDQKSNKTINPDKSFGFQTPKQKKQTLRHIDRDRKAVPMRDDDLFVTY